MISCVDIHLHLLAILMHMLNIIFALFLSCCFFMQDIPNAVMAHSAL